MIDGIAPCFIVREVPRALAFYRDRLGFSVLFEGPQPEEIFFGMVTRGSAMIMVKSVGVAPLPNRERHPWVGWDAYLYVPDPDALAAEYAARGVEFSKELGDTNDGLRGFELCDLDGYQLFFGRPLTHG